MQNTVKERLKEFAKSKEKSIRMFESKVGLTIGYINAIRVSIQPDKLQRIASYYPSLNTEWLLTGKGEMEKKEMNDSTIAIPQAQKIRFWPEIEATGSGIMSFDDTLKSGYTEMILPNFNDCTDAMRLVGDSMYPRYKAGQIIVFKEWTESFVEFGQTYLIITRNGYRMVKYLMPADKPGELKCVSENEKEFPPFNIEINDIYKLYLIKGTIDQNTY